MSNELLCFPDFKHYSPDHGDMSGKSRPDRLIANTCINPQDNDSNSIIIHGFIFITHAYNLARVPGTQYQVFIMLV